MHFWGFLVRTELTLALVVGLLFCSLATMEVPELINLVDNTSNDFSLVVFVKNAPTTVEVRMRHQGRPGLPSVPRSRQPSVLRTHSSILSLQASGDMLHVLCVQRT
jgi:hypothetical protein